ncbi:DUF2336 domain-containing protein [Indioceanicola profundi]|uniref:DUF2336 domain-containing protein n=1 Tax=Indioceanicola profundi TaxID=2220096 RepID=UPI001CEC9D45|nr:DUF2336 domain-containing protein [Indioceanicola profundi]
MNKPSTLSSSDVERLLTDRTAQARIDTMVKVVADLRAGLAGREAELARDVLERFARDAEIAVREAVAWQIYNSPLLSEELARRLANDVGRVAFPILRHVEQLADDFLLELIGQRDAEKQVAIAGRPTVSPAVADAIVETANLTAIGALLRNEGAEIGPPTLEKVADRYGDVPFVAEPMAGRAHLPMAVVEKLIARVSDELRCDLVERYGLGPEMVAGLVAHGREAATVLMLQPLVRQGTDMELFAHHLMLNGRLTASLLFRALCTGDIDLFVAGMAVRAGITVENARLLLLDDGGLALRAVFNRARIPALLLPPFRSALNVVKQLAYRGEEERRRYFQVAVLARVHADCGETEERAVDELLMQLFDQKTADMIEQAMEMAGMPFVPLREDGRGAQA